MAAASHNKMLSAALTFTLSFCRLYMTKKTYDLPLNTKNTLHFHLKSRGCFTWLKTIHLDAKAASISYILLLAALYLRH